MPSESVWTKNESGIGKIYCFDAPTNYIQGQRINAHSSDCRNYKMLKHIILSFR